MRAHQHRDIVGYVVDDVTDGELWPMQEDIVGLLRRPCTDIKQGAVT
jgi:hypothetical protein